MHAFSQCFQLAQAWMVLHCADKTWTAVSSASPGSRYPESMFGHPLGELSMVGFPFQRALQHVRRGSLVQTWEAVAQMTSEAGLACFRYLFVWPFLFRVLHLVFTNEFTGHSSALVRWENSIFSILHLGNWRKWCNKCLAQAHLGMCCGSGNVILVPFFAWHMLRRTQGHGIRPQGNVEAFGLLDLSKFVDCVSFFWVLRWHASGEELWKDCTKLTGKMVADAFQCK